MMRMNNARDGLRANERERRATGDGKERDGGDGRERWATGDGKERDGLRATAKREMGVTGNGERERGVTGSSCCSSSSISTLYK
jgi:hypothetical protein